MERKETFEEYFISTKNKKAGHPHKVTNSWGAYDYYRYYRRNKPKDKKYVITSDVFYKINRMINEAVADKLAKEHRIELPNRLGVIEFIMFKHKLEIVDGKLKTSRPIDWLNTLKLWYADPQAEKDRILIRKEAEDGISAHYYKSHAIYPNKIFYDFVIHRTVRRRYRDFASSTGYETPYRINNNLYGLYK